MKWSHSKCPCTGTIYCCHIVNYCINKCKISIVAVSAKPFWDRLSYSFQIHMWKYLTHKFTAPTRQKKLTCIITIHISKLTSTFFWRITYSNTASLIYIRAFLNLITIILKIIYCTFKGRNIRLHGTSKGWSHKAYSVTRFNKFRISHIILAYINSFYSQYFLTILIALSGISSL